MNKKPVAEFWLPSNKIPVIEQEVGNTDRLKISEPIELEGGKVQNIQALTEEDAEHVRHVCQLHSLECIKF